MHGERRDRHVHPGERKGLRLWGLHQLHRASAVRNREVLQHHLRWWGGLRRLLAGQRGILRHRGDARGLHAVLGADAILRWWCVRLHFARAVRDWELLHEPRRRGVFRLPRERPASLRHGWIAPRLHAVHMVLPLVFGGRLRLHGERRDRHVRRAVRGLLRRGELCFVRGGAGVRERFFLPGRRGSLPPDVRDTRGVRHGQVLRAGDARLPRLPRERPALVRDGDVGGRVRAV